MCKRIELHAHSDLSNLRLLDSINALDELILKASEMGMKKLALTEHETIASHVRGLRIVEELKKENKIDQNFSLILGNEIYLIDNLTEVKENYQSGITKFPHFLLLSKSKKGHEALRFLSSKAWENSFYTGMMERVPTTKESLEEIVKQYPNTLIGSSACLGSESSIHILNGDYDKAKDFLKWCSNLFGKDHFYLELQPSDDQEQRHVNEKLIEFSKELDLELIITTDAHYLRPEDADIHEAFLNAKQGDREVKSFYANTYLHTDQEIYEKLHYIDETIIDKAMENTLKIGDMIESYSLENETVIPKIELPKFELKHIFKQGYEQYIYIQKMAYSENKQDNYLLYLIEEGFLELLYKPDLTKQYFHEVLNRINIELGELWETSIKLNQAMSSYYVTIQQLVNIFWGDDCGEESRYIGSVVGSGRGSASGFLINYLLKITMINPLIWGVEMPHWRHLSSSRSDISSLDIDIDVAPEKRGAIFKRMKEYFGEDRVLQVATYGTQGSKSAIQTACRGLGADMEAGQYISSLVPTERGENWSISDCYYGNPEKERKKIPAFKAEMDKIPLLRETSMRIEGLIDKRSVHAGGVVLTNSNYNKSNSMMLAPNKTPITQLNLEDTQATGSIKYDVLGVSNISKLQQSLDIMLDEGMIEWQGTLRKTFNKYFHPENFDVENPKLYELLAKGEIPDLFQFDTSLATQALVTAKPQNLVEMAATNSLMRLMGDGKESPIETFAKYKKDISLWYKEMEDYGLNNEEIPILEKYLLPISGVADVQEVSMLLVQDTSIAGLDLGAANRLRKAIAKKSEKAYEAVRKEFYEGGKNSNTRKEMLDYVWEVQISRQRGYSFSILHTIAYSLIGLQNIEVVANYSPIIWHTACLTINSGSTEVDEGEKGKSTKYGKIAAAIGNLKSYKVNVELPLINSAKFGFTPDIKNNRIIFSLKGINGIGDDIAHEIIKNRPYNSFEDFYTRMYETKIISKGQFLKLIKAGSFNEFANQIEIMKQFLVKEVDVKTNLNGQNLPRVISLGLLDTPDLNSFKQFYNFKAHISKSVHSKTEKPKDRIFKLDSYSQAFLFNNFTDESIVGWEGEHPLVSEKVFKKEYDAKMKPLMEMLNEKEFLSKFNQAQFYELWNENAEGSPESWQMSSVSYYADKHELYPVDTNRYGISSFSDMPEEPIVLSENEGKNGRVYKNMKLYHVAGTVLEKTPNKNTITILTHDDKVVTVKMFGNNFSSYNRQIKTDGKITSKSFFTRGNLLLISGYRKGDQFTVKSERNQPSIQLITEVRNDGSIGLQSER